MATMLKIRLVLFPIVGMLGYLLRVYDGIVVVVFAAASDASATNVGLASDTSMSTSKFLWLSDVHYDPYYGTPSAYGHKQCRRGSSLYGQVGCDSPNELIETILKKVKKEVASTDSGIDFVVITGDLSRHGNDNISKNPMNDTESILYNVSQLLASNLLDTNSKSRAMQANDDTDNTTADLPSNLVIIPSIGNNDVTPDYYIDLDNPRSMLQMIWDGLSPILPSSDQQHSYNVASSMKRGGYMAYNVTKTLTVLSINTIIYSTRHMPIQQAYTKNRDPLQQFQWLEQQLNAAKVANRFVYIVGHIPPSIGSYRHTQFWHERYLTTYYSILDSFYDDNIIVGQLFGHIHSDEFRLIERKKGRGNGNRFYPIYLAPSITPIYGSNPSFRLVEYMVNNGQLVNYETCYMNLLDNGGGGDGNITFSKSLSFGDAYHVSDLSSASLQNIVHELESSITTPTSSSANDSSISGSSADGGLYYWETLLSRQHVFAAGDADVNDSAYKCDEYCRVQWLCTIHAITRKDYELCLARGVKTSARFILEVGLFSVVAAGVILAIRCIFKFVNKRGISWNRRQAYEPAHHQDQQPPQLHDHDDEGRDDAHHNGSSLNSSEPNGIAMTRMMKSHSPVATGMDHENTLARRNHPPEIT